MSNNVLSSQEVIKDTTSEDNVSIQGVTEEVTSVGSVTISGEKRKHSNEIGINEVSTSLKKARITGPSKIGECDHSYCIKSPRRLKTQVYGLVDKIENLTEESENHLSRKLGEGIRKVSTLASVVSELKEKNLINSDCASPA